MDGVCDFVVRREAPPLILILLRSRCVSVEVTRYFDPVPQHTNQEPWVDSRATRRRERIFRGKYDLTDRYQDVFDRRLGENALIRTTQGRVFARTVVAALRAIDILVVRIPGDVPDANSYEFTLDDLRLLLVRDEQFGVQVDYDSASSAHGDGQEGDNMAEDNTEGSEPDSSQRTFRCYRMQTDIR